MKSLLYPEFPHYCSISRLVRIKRYPHSQEKANVVSGDGASTTAAPKAPRKNATSRNPSIKKQKLSDGEAKSTGDDDGAGTDEEKKAKAAGRKRGRLAK